MMQKGQNTALVSKNGRGLLVHADQLKIWQNYENSETENTEELNETMFAQGFSVESENETVEIEEERSRSRSPIMRNPL